MFRLPFTSMLFIIHGMGYSCHNIRFFKSNAFFKSTLVLLNFSWIELQMLLRCCLIHITIIILRNKLYLVYLCLCLDLGLFISYLCDLFFIFSLIFIVINHIISFKHTYLFFVHCSEYFLIFLEDNVDKESQ